MESIVISVVIANYNYGRFLPDALDSVIAQCGVPVVCDDGRSRLPIDNSLVELIVVDGGSSDDSVEVIRRYENSIAWWVSERDNGQSDAFNKGFAHATGRLGCWLNADDLLLPGTLHDVIPFVKLHPYVEWIGGGTVWMLSDKTIVKCSMCFQAPKWAQKWMPGIIVGGPSSFFSIARLREVGGFDVNMHYMMDHDIWLKFMKRGVVLYMLKRYFWAFRLHECSKTASNVKESGLENKVGEGSSDSAILNRRYPRTMRWWHFICKLLAVCKLLDGTYLKSWHDTRLNSGMHIDRLKF